MRKRLQALLRALRRLLAGSPALSAALAAGVAMALVLLVYEPGFEVNDDAVMLRIAAGLSGLPADEHLIFIHFAAGWILKRLYGLTQWANWYTGTLYTVLLGSMIAAFYCVLSQGVTATRLTSCIAIFSLVFWPWLLRLNFTATAALATLSGYCLLATAIDHGAPPRRGAMLGGILLVGIGALVRFDCFLLSSILAGPFLAARLGRTRSVSLVIGCALAAILGTGIELANRAYYQRDPDWAAYMEFNRVRGRIHDSLYKSPPATVERALAATGWTMTDWQLFRMSLFDDPAVYRTSTLKKLVEVLADAPPDLKVAWADFRKLASNNQLPYFAICFLFGLFVTRQRRLEYALMGSLQIAVILAIGAYLAIYGKPTERVWLPALQSLALVTLIWVSHDPTSRFGAATGRTLPSTTLSGFSKRESCGFLLFAACLGGIVQSRLTMSDALVPHFKKQWQNTKDLARELHAIQERERDEVLFVAEGDELRLGGVSPLRSTRVFGGLNLLLGGWGTFSPLYQAQLKKFRITNLFVDIVDRSDVFLVARPQGGQAYISYMKERYGKNLVLEEQPRPLAFRRLRAGRIYRIRSTPQTPFGPVEPPAPLAEKPCNPR
jgi:hypothetical protein